MKVNSGIYAIVNMQSPDNKMYVGSAVNLKKRWNGHKFSLKRNNHGNKKLQGAWDKYSKEAFRFLVIEEVKDVNDLIKREQFWIDKTDSVNKGYNICFYAVSQLGVKRSDEFKRKLSESHKGEKNPMFGKTGIKHPNYGRRFSKEHRRKLSKSHIGSQSHLGIKHSEKTKRKISETKTGTNLSEEHKKNIAKSMKIKAAKGKNQYLYGKHISKNIRKKMSKARKNYFKKLKGEIWV